MRPKEFDLDFADASLTGFASNVTGAAFTITTSATSDGIAHQVSVRNDSVNDHSAKTVTLVGKDENRQALTEVVTGPAGSATVESTGYFSELDGATPSATIGADTFDIGWVDEARSQIIPLDHRSETAATFFAVVTGTINYTIRETFDRFQDTILAAQSAQWNNLLANQTTSQKNSASVGATGLQLVVNSYSSGAEIQLHVSQPNSL
jgi:hypothetical protein